MTNIDSSQVWSVQPGVADAPPMTQAGGGKDFSRVIGRTMKSGETARQREAKVYRHVEELVAQTLVAPVLEKLREDPFESGLFKKTHGEKALRPLIDAEVAKDIVHHMRTGLVEQMARRLLNPDGTALQTGGRRTESAERRSWHA